MYCVFCLHVCLCTTHMPDVHGGQKEDVGSLRLESEGCKPLLMAVHQSQLQPVLLKWLGHLSYVQACMRCSLCRGKRTTLQSQVELSSPGMCIRRLCPDGGSCLVGLPYSFYLLQVTSHFLFYPPFQTPPTHVSYSSASLTFEMWFLTRKFA